MSFSALSRIVWARKLTFLTVFLLITAGAVAFCLLATPIFQSTALLMISSGRSQGQQQQQAPFPDTIRYQINSQIYIIESEDVLRHAIAQIGPQTLFPQARSWFPQMQSWDVPKFFLIDLQEVLSSLANSLGSTEGSSDLDKALMKVQKRLAVSAEKDSQVLALTFRHEDAIIAEKFLQLVVDGFIQRQADLSGNAEAPSFFRQQAAHYRDDYRKASTHLNEFSQKHSTYSISQEIALALGRRDEAVAALAKTRGSIAEKEAQAATLQNTLTQLRRRISLPAEVTGPKYRAPSGGEDALTDANKIPTNESPLLLVRVFQETAQSLVNLNSSIVGLRALETAQNKSLSNIEQRLGDLSSVEAEFGRLKSEVDQAAKILEAHVGRAAEAQMNADWDASEKLSSVKVVQAATAPVKPVFPPKPLVIALGMVIGLVGGAAASTAADAMSSRRRRSAPQVPERNQFYGDSVRTRLTCAVRIDRITRPTLESESRAYLVQQGSAAVLAVARPRDGNSRPFFAGPVSQRGCSPGRPANGTLWRFLAVLPCAT
jgi:succinoglycan biosynthesis transport protein ExoP